MNDLLTTRQAAEYCGMRHEQFRLYVKTGRVTPALRLPRQLLFAKAELDAFLARPRRPPGWPRKSAPPAPLPSESERTEPSEPPAEH